MAQIQLPETIEEFCIRAIGDASVDNEDNLRSEHHHKISNPFTENALATGRPLNTALHVPAGYSGAGKSTLVNVRFDDPTLCQTSQYKSETLHPQRNEDNIQGILASRKAVELLRTIKLHPYYPLLDFGDRCLALDMPTRNYLEGWLTNLVGSSDNMVMPGEEISKNEILKLDKLLLPTMFTGKLSIGCFRAVMQRYKKFALIQDFGDNWMDNLGQHLD